MQLPVCPKLSEAEQEEIWVRLQPWSLSTKGRWQREAEPNVIGPFANLEGLITYILVQGTAVNEPAADTESDEAPAVPAVPKPKQLKKPKASKPAPSPKISKAKPLATAPPEDSV